MPITEQEAREKSQEKIKKIKALAKELSVTMSAKQVITKGNFIETVIIFTDEEQYDLEKPAPRIVRLPKP